MSVGRFVVAGAFVVVAVAAAVWAGARFVERGGPAESPDRRAVALGTVEGRVTDAAGAPVAGARVTWDGALSPTERGAAADLVRETTTDARGEYRMATLAARLQVEVRHPPQAAWQKVGIEVAKDAVVRVDAVLEPGATIAGRATYANGAPARKAVVRAWCFSEPDVEAALGDDGSFRLEGVRPGRSYRLSLRGPTVADDTETAAQAGDENVRVRAARGAPITGFARFEDGRAAVGASVVASSSGDGASGKAHHVYRPHSATTDADGAFRVEGLSAGSTYDVLVGMDPRRTSPDICTARAKDVPAGTVGLTIHVVPGVRIVGRVVGPDGEPVDEGTVLCVPVEEPPQQGEAAWDQRLLVIRDADVQDGRFELRGLAPVAYRLTVEAKPLATRVVVVEAGAKDVSVRLAKGATIKGRVLLPGGRPATEASVEIDDESDDAPSSDCDADAEGRFVLECVAAGVHRLIASFDTADESYEGEVTGVRVEEGGTVEGVEIRLKKSE